jgi:para-nitrobenzyl esterase
MAAATISATALIASGPTAQAERTDPVVATTAGELRGVVDGGLVRFQGVPYAAAPTGDRRWSPPQPVEAWSGIRDATEPAPICVQPEAPDMPAALPQSEDCLTVNVTAPADAEDLPVLVWIPGGGFVTGAGSVYDPARLVETGEIIVVTMNYRLGVFGFFAHPELGEESNFGLQDQIAALEWVRDDIAAFGGDPDNVTLAGASAGAMSTCTLMTSPSASDLFHRAIVQSGSCSTGHPAGAFGPGIGAVDTWHPLATVQGTGAALAEGLSCADLTCLRQVPAEELLPYTGMFPLIAHGTDLVPREPAAVFDDGDHMPVPLLQGNTRDEHVEFTTAAYPDGLTTDQYAALLRTAFGHAAERIERHYPARDFASPTAAAARVFSDYDWICPSWRTGRDHADVAPVYAYVFNDPSAPTPSGAPLPEHVRPATAHGGDMPYLFDFPNGPGLTDAQRPLAQTLVDYWTAFVRSGDPNGPHVSWPRLDRSDQAMWLAPESIAPVDMKGTFNCGLWRNVSP